MVSTIDKLLFNDDNLIDNRKMAINVTAIMLSGMTIAEFDPLG